VRLGRTAGAGEVFALRGDLGAGKTCLIQGLAEGLGITSPVTSPTFVLISEHRGRLPLYHVDLYRMDSLAEVRALGLEDLLADWRDGVTAIEWAERAEVLLPAETVWLTLEGAGDEERTIEVAGVERERLELSGA
jgi:tRNA threonylcarbamoyladenosine biosynthesis protein TsaE